MDERAVDRTPDTGQKLGALSASAAADHLGVNERTIRRAIARGELPATKRAGVYQIDPENLQRYQTRRRLHVQSMSSTPRDRLQLIPFPPSTQTAAFGLPHSRSR